MSVIRWVVRKGGSANRWLAALVARKPKMVATVALANEMTHDLGNDDEAGGLPDGCIQSLKSSS